MHQIRFVAGLCPGPRWGSARFFSRSPIRMGGGTPSPYLSPLKPSASRSQRLGLDAFGVYLVCCYFPIECFGTVGWAGRASSL